MLLKLGLLLDTENITYVRAPEISLLASVHFSRQYLCGKFILILYTKTIGLDGYSVLTANTVLMHSFHFLSLIKSIKMSSIQNNLI